MIGNYLNTDNGLKNATLKFQNNNFGEIECKFFEDNKLVLR